MSLRTIISYNPLITAFSWSFHQTHRTFKLLAQLDVECFRPNESNEGKKKMAQETDGMNVRNSGNGSKNFSRIMKVNWVARLVENENMCGKK